MSHPIVFLIGYMGVGKTTVGMDLASQLGYLHKDSDDEIEAHIGMTIPDIFKQYGERYFRTLEHQWILNLKIGTATIISCGGGLPCHHDHILRMREMGQVIWLDLPIDAIINRIGDNHDRPLLSKMTSSERRTFITQQLSQRKIYYGQANTRYPQENQSDLTQIIIRDLDLLANNTRHESTQTKKKRD